ncbi:TPA: hypothetical protein ACH3X1_003782 [Trebouxia sp. C0004]
MALAAMLGGSLGVVGGLAAGARYFSTTKATETYKELDISADHDDSVQIPDMEGRPVPASASDVLPWTPEWTKWPDYERIPVVQAVNIDLIDLGTYPLKFGGVKAYETVAEEGMLEVPVQWGSNARVRVSARLGFGGYCVDIPVEVRDIQLKARARITLKPLVETIPCLGAVNISLLEVPTVDLALSVINSLDLMAIPGLNLAVNFGLKMALGTMLIYPNSMTFDIMEGGGIPPPPQGMLSIKVLRAHGLGSSGVGKIDPFVELTVRTGRVKRTETVHNNTHPEWNEELQFIVDDPDTQAISVVVKDDDVLSDTITGVAQIPLADADFILDPKSIVPVTVDLIRPERAGLGKFVGGGQGGIAKVGKSVGKAGLSGGQKIANVATFGKLGGKSEKKDSGGKEAYKVPKADRGTVFLEMQYHPFKAAGKAAAANEPGAQKANMTLGMSKKMLTHDHKGVLTITLIRCVDLEDNAEGQVDPFVELELDDPVVANNEIHTSPIIMNEPSPRWNVKYDYIMISATSTVTATVYDKQGFFDGIMSLPKTLLGKKPEGKKRLGFIKIDVADVVENRHLLDTWPLMDSQQGEIEMKLEWMPLQLENI